MKKIINQIVTDLYSKKYIFFSFFIILFWGSLWLSINTLTSEIYYFGQNIIKTINSLRIIIPLILSFFLFFYLIIYQSKKVNLSVVNNNFFFLFLLFFLVQVLGELQNFSLQSILSNFHLIVFGIATILIFPLITFFRIEKILKYMMFISILIIFLICIVISSQILININIQDYNYFYSLIDANSKNIMGQDFPRITGLSRSFALLNLFNLIFFFIYKKNKYIKYILLLLIPFITAIIWAMQSRGTLLCYLVVFFLFFVVQKKILVKEKIFFFSYFILLPVFIFQFYIYYNQEKILKNNFSYMIKNNITIKFEEENKKINFIETFGTTRFGILDSVSSGRMVIWNDLIHKYDKKKLFGYGPQADRKLISTNINNLFSNNASNAFLYSFVCGGYFGLLFFFLLNIKILTCLYKIFLIENKLSNSVPFIAKLSFIYLIFFLIRQFFENSFTLFSIDFLITILSFAIIDSFLNNKRIN